MKKQRTTCILTVDACCPFTQALGERNYFDRTGTQKFRLVSTSLHLDHGLASIDQAPGDAPTMQAFVPVGLLSLKAAADRALDDQEIRVIELSAP